ncbi:MAG TPA: dihydropteroate synthase [Candidatus Acidoferrum sp.]|nr:dihydropteroate synthase [Candidatus Acidoferrum sp.]
MGRFLPIDFRRARLDWSRPYVMGVVNVTPDSFSPAGRFTSVDDAVAHALQLDADGADLIDVGGESTRPLVGTGTVTPDVEIQRVLPVIERLAGRTRAILSVDTSKAAVAGAAAAAGAELVNDISGGRFDPELVAVTAAAGAALVCGHLRGGTIAEVHSRENDPPTFDQVVDELGERLAALPPDLRRRTVCDPGLGFGKRTPQNLELSRRAGELAARLSCPVMLGPSRKRFLGELTGRPVGDRDAATIGAALAAVAAGAHVVRVHDVSGVTAALRVFRAVRGEEPA